MIALPVIFDPGLRGKPKRFLRAHEILIAVHLELVSSIIGRPVDDVSRSLFRQSLREALLSQLQLRGMDDREIPETELDVIEDERGFTIMTEPDWVKAVDRALGNRDCPRCGSLLVTPLPHDVDECDLVVLRDVLDS